MAHAQESLLRTLRWRPPGAPCCSAGVWAAWWLARYLGGLSGRRKSSMIPQPEISQADSHRVKFLDLPLFAQDALQRVPAGHSDCYWDLPLMKINYLESRGLPLPANPVWQVSVKLSSSGTKVFTIIKEWPAAQEIQSVLYNRTSVVDRLSGDNVSSISLLQPERLSFRTYSTEAGEAEPTEPAAADTESRFKEKPWEYFESEEYIERYGSNPVWFGYRRNHKGQIPPQKTRKTCIRGKHICGNPCPICRDKNLFLDYRNVRLLEQFISPYTGIAYHPTHTGICMKKYQQLTKAIEMARDNGLLSSTVSFTAFHEDYSNQHPAVTKTPPSPALQNKTAWYEWYDWQQPPEKEIQRMRRMYKDYLKEESSPP